MKILVTGGAGFIGSNLVDELINLGHDVVCVDSNIATSNENFYYNEKADNRVSDVCNLGELRQAMAGCDYVFHMAAQSRVQESVDRPRTSFQSNVIGVANVLEVAKDVGVKRVIYSMTSSVYGDHPVPHLEDMIPKPLSPYAVSKLAGEQLCRVYSELYGLDTVSLRYFNVYGPREPSRGEYATVVKKFQYKYLEDAPLTIVGDGEQRRDFTHVSDIVAANIAAMNYEPSLKGEIFNIGSGKNYSINEIARMISDKHEYVPARPGEARETLADNSKAWRVLGWKPKQSLQNYLGKTKPPAA